MKGNCSFYGRINHLFSGTLFEGFIFPTGVDRVPNSKYLTLHPRLQNKHSTNLIDISRF